MTGGRRQGRAPAAPRERPRETLAQRRYHRMYSEVRQRICLLYYKPGDHLAEEDLAREFGVSRTPIRRVLNRLEAEGLVESQVGVGTLVTDIAPEEVESLYAFRVELAGLIGRLDPVRRTKADLRRLDGLLARVDALAEDPEPTEYLKVNMAFFQELMGVVGNRYLRETLERLYYQVTRIVLSSIPNDQLRDEVEIFRREVADIREAMDLGNYAAIGSIRSTHISMSFCRLQRYISRRE